MTLEQWATYYHYLIAIAVGLVISVPIFVYYTTKWVMSI
jgi:hypothetical protein